MWDLMPEGSPLDEEFLAWDWLEQEPDMGLLIIHVVAGRECSCYSRDEYTVGGYHWFWQDTPCQDHEGDPRPEVRAGAVLP